MNKIIPFSAVDGPGNRTAVFLQGCNFDCAYCHNPETRNLCRDCGECVKGCPAKALSMEDGRVRYRPGLCCLCDACIKTCAFGCSPRIQWMDAKEVSARVQKQVPYIRGITVSGGECTLYPDFLEDLFALCKEQGLGTLIDSNGTLDFSGYPRLLDRTDGVMLDVKAWTREDHVRVTGEDNAMVLKNLEYLASVGKLCELRTVIVPGLFDYRLTVEKASGMAAKYLDKGDIRYKIIAYRPMGVRKDRARWRVPDKEELEKLAVLAYRAGLRDVVIV